MSDLTSQARRPGCLWCRQPDLTREHVFPQWLRKEVTVPPGGEVIGRNRIRQLQRTWDGKIFDLVSKSVCATCNNGWMSELEQRARSVLTTLLHSDSTVLDDDAQLAIAEWAFKTACIFDQVMLPACIPRRHIRSFYASKRVPRDVHVFLAQRQIEVLPAFGRDAADTPAIAQLKLRRGIVSGTGVEVYTSFIVLGGAFVQVIGFCNNVAVEGVGTLVGNAIELAAGGLLEWPNGFPNLAPEALDANSWVKPDV
jgi:hypothetical protein